MPVGTNGGIGAQESMGFRAVMDTTAFNSSLDSMVSSSSSADAKMAATRISTFRSSLDQMGKLWETHLNTRVRMEQNSLKRLQVSYKQTYSDIAQHARDQLENVNDSVSTPTTSNSGGSNGSKGGNLGSIIADAAWKALKTFGSYYLDNWSKQINNYWASYEKFWPTLANYGNVTKDEFTRLNGDISDLIKEQGLRSFTNNEKILTAMAQNSKVGIDSEDLAIKSMTDTLSDVLQTGFDTMSRAMIDATTYYGADYEQKLIAMQQMLIEEGRSTGNEELVKAAGQLDTIAQSVAPMILAGATEEETLNEIYNLVSTLGNQGVGVNSSTLNYANRYMAIRSGNASPDTMMSYLLSNGSFSSALSNEQYQSYAVTGGVRATDPATQLAYSRAASGGYLMDPNFNYAVSNANMNVPTDTGSISSSQLMDYYNNDLMDRLDDIVTKRGQRDNEFANQVAGVAAFSSEMPMLQDIGQELVSIATDILGAITGNGLSNFLGNLVGNATGNVLSKVGLNNLGSLLSGGSRLLSGAKSALPVIGKVALPALGGHLASRVVTGGVTVGSNLYSDYQYDRRGYDESGLTGSPDEEYSPVALQNTDTDKARDTGKVVGEQASIWGSIAAGAAAGGGIGAVAGGIGAVPGAIIGGIVGGITGLFAKDTVGEAVGEAFAAHEGKDEATVINDDEITESIRAGLLAGKTKDQIFQEALGEKVYDENGNIAGYSGIIGQDQAAATRYWNMVNDISDDLTKAGHVIADSSANLETVNMSTMTYWQSEASKYSRGGGEDPQLTVAKESNEYARITAMASLQTAGLLSEEGKNYLINVLNQTSSVTSGAPSVTN